ncbi:ParB/RepB/Spo0J family partition protein [Phenylobacterium sp.]|uniref:ParB/RepB/Spo0J family partition protein n=1 Tax=Phenylobacterium sp. TaxID=1871053 RepID=UPI0027360766|nr:ParB/RepB/Spo0J family partition protein [Phenylobacterium sp.]MDP3853648.1 ParB/RepB/Spo0J family partition protein [Phenylobacterium sp.]
MTELTPMAISAAPLLRAIAAGGDLSPKALAEASGRKSNNIARDLARVAEQGWVTREPGSPPALTDAGQGILDTLDSKGPVAPAPDGEGFAHVPLDLIDRDPTLNPREIFDDAELEALASSIRDKGVAQPILLRLGLEAGRFRIVAGERRFRASQKADRPTIPAMIRDLDDAQALEIATIENIQRVNLSPLEEAKAFKKIIANRMAADPALELKDAKAAIADAVRKTVRYVEQRMDLLELPPILQKRLELDPDDGAYLNLKEARREVQSMRSREREAKAKILPADELLALAEFYDAVEQFAETLPGWWYGQQLPLAVGYRALEDNEPLAYLVKRNALYVSRGWKADARHFVREGYGYSKQEVARQLPGFNGKTRAATLHALRVKVIGQPEAEKIDKTWSFAGQRGEYATWAFNEPFRSTPDPALEEAAEAYRLREQEESQRQFNRAAEEQRQQEEQAAHKARVARELGPFGKDFLAAVRALEAGAADMAPDEFWSAFNQVQTDFECEGPYSLQLSADGKDAVLVDGQGRLASGYGPCLEARRRLIAVALNYAAGRPPTSGPDLDTPWSRPEEPEPEITRERFVDMVAGHLEDDMGVGPVVAGEMAEKGLAAVLADEGIEFGDPMFEWDHDNAMSLANDIRLEDYGQQPAEDEDEDATAEAEAEKDTPEYLTRLAGGGAAAEPELEREEG